MNGRTVLQNNIILANGVPARMHFTDHEIAGRDIIDPLTQKPKTVKALIFTVDELDGNPVTASYSTISEKHASQFAPYLGDKSYRDKLVTITPMGSGFSKDWLVSWAPRKS